MQNNNYLSLVNFKVKLHRRTFFITMLDVQIFLNVENVASRGVFKRYAE